MSLKTLLMPHVTGYLFSQKRLLARRAKLEHARKIQGRAHEVHVFIQADDPYSYLLLQVLPLLISRYSIQMRFYLVSQPEPEAMPEPQKAIDYSVYDASLLAEHTGLDFARSYCLPTTDKVQVAERALADCLSIQDSIELCGRASKVLKWLWGGLLASPKDFSQSSPEHTLACIQHGDQRRKKLGHYLSGMLYYEGEWYWAIDRLYHLEERLRGLGVARPPARGVMFPPFKVHSAVVNQPLGKNSEVDFFFSFRSPYSAIVAERLFKMAALQGFKVNLRFVLPMVMRGLPVPARKKRYIVDDTAREASALGIDFGRINDPVGEPTERGLSIIPLAVECGLGEQYVVSFMKGVWAEGIDAGSDSGLKKITERVGLDWQKVQLQLLDESWRTQAEQNREALFNAGLWGVPSFKVGDKVFWGQDRLWAVQNALKEFKTQ